MISYLGWTMVRVFTYKWIECKKNKSLVRCIDWLSIETVHEITEILKDQTILLKFVVDLRLIACWWIDRIFYYYVDQLDGSSIVRGLIKNREFVWLILNLSSIVEVDLLLAAWKKVDRLSLSMWADFLRWAKILASEKGKKYCNFCRK